MDGAVQALSEIVHLIDIGVMPRMASTGDVPQELMAQGKLAMMISGPWDWPNLMKSGIDFGVRKRKAREVFTRRGRSGGNRRKQHDHHQKSGSSSTHGSSGMERGVTGG